MAGIQQNDIFEENNENSRVDPATLNELVQLLQQQNQIPEIPQQESLKVINETVEAEFDKEAFIEAVRNYKNSI